MDDSDVLELKRQGIHLLNGFFITAAVYVLKPIIGLWVLAPLVLALILLFTVPRFLPGNWISDFLMRHFERRKDIEEFPFKGAIYYGLGIIFPIALLEVRYCCAVILILSVGDCFSTLIGRRYGRTRIGKRSLEGAVGFLATAWPAATVMVGPVNAFWLAFAGSLVELFDPFNDNITVPAALTFILLI